MIVYLRGEVIEQADGKLIIGCGGVGYVVSVPQTAAYDGFLPGKAVQLYVHTHVREDTLDLYGFSHRFEKELFLTLLSVNGIGPKGALGILSKVPSNQLVQAILDEDKETLIQIPGIGKKTAERVVLELAEPLRKKMDSGAWAEFRKPNSSSLSTAKEVGFEHSAVRDAKVALLGLGYRENEIGAVLNRMVSEAGDFPVKAEDLIRQALRNL